DVGENDAEPTGTQLDPVKPVAGDGTSGLPGAVKAEAGDERRRLGNERLLNRAGLLGFVVHALVEKALLIEQAGVFDGHGDVAGERLKDRELVFREAVEFAVVYREDADDLSAGDERDVDSRKAVRLARDVVGVEADV